MLQPPLEALLDAGLLESSRWLEANELHASVARAWLGATVAEVIKTLTASAALSVSGDTQRLLKHDNRPMPSARAAQLIVLGGGHALSLPSHRHCRHPASALSSRDPLATLSLPLNSYN